LDKKTQQRSEVADASVIYPTNKEYQQEKYCQRAEESDDKQDLSTITLYRVLVH